MEAAYLKSECLKFYSENLKKRENLEHLLIQMHSPTLSNKFSCYVFHFWKENPGFSFFLTKFMYYIPLTGAKHAVDLPIFSRTFQNPFLRGVHVYYIPALRAQSADMRFRRPFYL
jgi:hypothetical protein